MHIRRAAVRSILAIATFLLLLLPACAPPAVRPNPGVTDPIRAARQAVIVVTDDWNTSAGHLETFERASAEDAWTPVGAPAAFTLGSNGLGWGSGLHGHILGDGPAKHEGDRRSPAGAFALSAVYGYASEQAVPRLKMPYIPLDSGVVCVDDPTSAYYNRIVDRSLVTNADWHSQERMRLMGKYYTWGVIVDHNTDPRVPGDGSCIFLHVWGGPTEATTGCTTFDEQRLVELISWLDPARHPVLVQLPRAEYERFRGQWRLPPMP